MMPKTLSLLLLAWCCACGPRDLIRAQVLDAASGFPLENVIIAAETGGIYVDNPDKTLGNPAYVFGAITDAKGTFVLTLDKGQYVGFHTFLDGYRYGQLSIEGVGYAVAEFTMGKKLAADLSPTLTQPTLSSSTVKPGETITVTVVATAASPADPLSEEILVVEPITHFSIAMQPPAPGGMPGAWPDGIWVATFAAPAAPGKYTLHLVGTSENCITADGLTLELTVE